MSSSKSKSTFTSTSALARSTNLGLLDHILEFICSLVFDCYSWQRGRVSLVAIALFLTNSQGNAHGCLFIVPCMRFTFISNLCRQLASAHPSPGGPAAVGVVHPLDRLHRQCSAQNMLWSETFSKRWRTGRPRRPGPGSRRILLWLPPLFPGQTTRSTLWRPVPRLAPLEPEFVSFVSQLDSNNNNLIKA